jgi:oxygen-independent coproporphyrinogen-3 oxidase
VTEEGFRALRAGGFTRISIGVQSFQPRTLRTLGRIHGVEEVRAAHRGARRAGFSSIGMDLIFGIPGQESADWADDLDRTITFLPAHVSAYALAAEHGTPIHRAIGRGEISMPPDDEVARMYEETRAALARAGYRHYEISNFARPGEECRHNITYWRREEYAASGPPPTACSSLPARTRSACGRPTPVARRLPAPDREGRLLGGRARLQPEDAWKDRSLRTADARRNRPEGDRKRIGPPPANVRSAVEPLVRAGRLQEAGSRVRLPPHLLFVSNEVLQEFA